MLRNRSANKRKKTFELLAANSINFFILTLQNRIYFRSPFPTKLKKKNHKSYKTTLYDATFSTHKEAASAIRFLI